MIKTYYFATVRAVHIAAPQIRVRLTLGQIRVRLTALQIEHTVTFSKPLVFLSLAIISSMEKGIDMIQLL